MSRAANNKIAWEYLETVAPCGVPYLQTVPEDRDLIEVMMQL